ncbi:MAG: Rne/Rng family ribonuclease [Rickettsiales bacterium]|nr:Rne/Rng family ribonuclease [Rickettsiales bacterium]
MKNKIILIDAAHREETRVAVLEDGILQDFDREAIAIKQIKGNMYLAKVTRVEQSLQAAFVDYGSDKHGFLPFGDIHPNYFQISEEERQSLLKDTQKNESDFDESPQENSEGKDKSNDEEKPMSNQSYSVEDETDSYKGNIYSIHKKYNIQDVIKPGQLVLVQCAKDERGNKGASMTTYISIAGKYSVLMANTPNKGGVSKKVENFRDRKLLRSILQEMNVPSDRSVIIRTAGVGKKPEEITRDYEYLAKLWDKIKEMTETSKAPAFIHAEDDIIKKCIRDIYNDEIKEVVVEGKESFETVLDFAKLTSSSEINNIKFYQDRVPIFDKFRVEQQISALYEKQINLPSGGSIVIDHTEALVAIDVNSGKSTKESNVEETAYQTNLEAAKEIAKQLRLRDLAGLVVIDFIDMYDQKNRRGVERTLRDELQFDRARIQLGRISAFGLLEMSRQRLGVSFFETITQVCHHCNGTGFVRSVEILAVSILRAIRRACSDDQTGVIYIYTTPETIAYMMNFKRDEIAGAEKFYGVHIFMHTSDEVGGSGFNLKKRKKLSEDEKREIEMNIVTGKVNELGLEKEYMDDIRGSDNYDDEKPKRPQKNRNNQRRNNNNRNRKKPNNNTPSKKKSLMSSVLGVFK